MRDIVLITIDCWRHDTLLEMPEVVETSSAFTTTAAISHGGATNGALPGVLAGSYLSTAYDDDGQVRITSLPEQLGEAGYNTAAIGASNPFLGKWAEHFDFFWNDGMDASDTAINMANYSIFSKAIGFGKLESRVPAQDLISRAKERWDSMESPRFLWLHFMDLHSPYYPGIRGGLRNGLIRTYNSLFQHARSEVRPQALSSNIENHLKNLYWQCVRDLDSPLSSLLQYFEDDTVVAVTGDHGEELYHGIIGHARLYDESIRVPLLTRGLDFDTSSIVQHMEIAPMILDSEGLTPPESWDGVVSGRESKIAKSIIFAQYGYIIVSTRSNNKKVIKYFDHDTKVHQKTERFDLLRDPHELDSIQDLDGFENLEKQIREHICQKDILSKGEIAYETGLDANVDDRLKQLGYKD